MKEEKRRIDYQVYTFSALEWVKYIAIGTAIGSFAVWICYQSVLEFPVAVILAFFYVRSRKKQMAVDRRKKLNQHFRTFLTSLHTSMFAGYSLENGVKSAAKDVQQLYGEKDVLTLELQDIVRQLRYGKRVEDLFMDFGNRSHVEDIRSFGEVVSIAKRTGGNMSQILDVTWRNLTEKIDTQQEIDTGLAARRYEQTLMAFMPAAMILYMRLTFQGFIERMYGNLPGVVIMSGCLAVYLLAIWLGRKMMGEKL